MNNIIINYWVRISDQLRIILRGSRSFHDRTPPRRHREIAEGEPIRMPIYRISATVVATIACRQTNIIVVFVDSVYDYVYIWRVYRRREEAGAGGWPRANYTTIVST